MTIIDIDKVGEALNTKADIDLNNTGVFSTSEGGVVNLASSTPANASGKEVTSADFFQSNLLNYTTNRILEIPQDIKLELNNGTVTLKAGSKVYVPNGKDSSGNNIFDEVVLSEDLIRDEWDTNTGLSILFTDSTTIHIQSASSPVSGATAPSDVGANQLWYDTSNNSIKYYNGSEWVTTVGSGSFSLPIALITRNSTGVPSSFAQIFNGFGYIGSTVFVLPGVKVQIPNGRNEDGTCNYLLKETTSVIRTSISGSGINQYIMIDSNGNIAGPSDQVKYDSELNSYIYTHDNLKRLWCIFAELDFESGKITSWIPYTVDSVLNSNLSNLSPAGEAKLKSNIQLVNELPANPVAGVLYCIPEA